VAGCRSKIEPGRTLGGSGSKSSSPRRGTDPTDRDNASLANALQIAHVVYLVGALFVGIAYQPFIFYIVAIEVGLLLAVKRRAAPHETARHAVRKAPMQPIGLAGQA